jgi:hypothetical protein
MLFVFTRAVRLPSNKSFVVKMVELLVAVLVAVLVYAFVVGDWSGRPSYGMLHPLETDRHASTGLRLMSSICDKCM